jgi:hypothetical protein
MSNYHLLTQAQDKKTINVIFHIPIPDVQNAAEKSYRLALKEMLEHASETGTIESICPDITAAELTQIQNGEIYEISRSKRFSSLSLTNAQKRDELDVEFNILKTEARSELQIELEWWGLKRDVV